jgi:glycosyltransferase involved in cell wall biosynthesis|tara:strand:- start:92182 stop:93258 length:1077 start_codon:yes stop_codon:yes gene_type:complete
MKILHLIDSLNPGGAERMAVAYANALARRGEEVFLWSTRQKGLLKESLDPGVKYHFLNRKGPIGLPALWQAKKLVQKHGIQIVHAHSTSFFFATLLKWLCPDLRLIWHDHYGNSEMLHERKRGVLRFCSLWFDAVFTVNRTLESWARKQLKCAEVHYIRNFTTPQAASSAPITLLGTSGKRMVCVANMRAQKDHNTLLEAFKRVSQSAPDWTLHLIGKNWEDHYYRDIQEKMTAPGLSEKVFYYGSCENIPGLLQQASLGVLSSVSEGLPLALLEYGLAGLPVVCTDVGYCREVVQHYGQLVSAKDPTALSDVLSAYIHDSQKREQDARAFQKHIREHYTEAAVLPEVISMYKRLLKG